MDHFIYGVGLLAIGVVIAILMALLAACLVILWARFAPRLMYRAPKTRILLKAYRRDVADGEGRPVQVAGDLELTRLIGWNWRLKWFFGLMLMRPVED